jgi:hypothetical protein
LERRVEPRLKTETPASLTVIRQETAREVQCLIIDVSSVGYGLWTGEPLEPGETIQLHLNGARVLAVVRHCGLSEDGKYSTGVERVDEWVAESRTTVGLLQQSSTGGDEPKRTLGRPKVNSLSRLSAIAIRHLFSEMAPKTTPGESRKIGKIALAAVAALAIVLVALFFSNRLPLGLRASSTAPGSAANTKVTKQIQPSQSSAANASATNASQAQSSTEPHPEALAKVVETQAPSAVPPVMPADKPQQAAASPSAVGPQHASAPQGSQHQILITGHDRSWVFACADGKKVFEKLITAGDREQINFSTQALLHAGNAGALDIVVDSHSLGSMGERGTIHAWRFSPEGYMDVPHALNRTCEIR